MSILTALRYDLTYLRRNKRVWLAGSVLILLSGAMAYVFTPQERSTWTQTVANNEVFVRILRIMSVIVPLVALVVTYRAVVGARESGRIKFLLSLPNDRREFFIGHFLSRSVAVGGSIIAMCLLAGAILAVRHGTFPSSIFVGVLLFTLVFAQTYVNVAFGISASVRSSSRVVAGIAGWYLVSVVFYVFPMFDISDVVHWLHHDVLGRADNPDLYHFVEYLSPLTAYHKSMNLVLPVELGRHPFVRKDVREVTKRASLEADLPVYLRDEFSLAVFAFWLVVPLAVSYVLFRQTDLH